MFIYPDELQEFFEDIRDHVGEELKKAGIEFEFNELFPKHPRKSGAKVKVVFVSPDLAESVEELGRSPRDQVLMVRVDEQTMAALDAWVATGAVKSRSEAAALFIKEGLGVRADELGELEEALRDVESARERLRRKAREVFGGRGRSED